MGMTAYMATFFIMVVLGLIMIIASIVLAVAYTAKKSEKGKLLRWNPIAVTSFACLWGLFFLLFTIVGTVEPQYEPEDEKVIQVASPQPEKIVVTLDELNSLKAGMSQKEVEMIIGEEGEFLYESEDYIGGIVAYRWENSPKGFAILNFEKNENGKLYYFSYYYVDGKVEK